MFVNNDINQTNLNKIQDDEMALSEHIEEFSQRLIFCLILLVLLTLICFADIKQIVQIFQIPAVGIKFLQFAPGEYFFASVKIGKKGQIKIPKRSDIGRNLLQSTSSQNDIQLFLKD